MAKKNTETEDLVELPRIPQEAADLNLTEEMIQVLSSQLKAKPKSLPVWRAIVLLINEAKSESHTSKNFAEKTISWRKDLENKESRF